MRIIKRLKTYLNASTKAAIHLIGSLLFRPFIARVNPDTMKRDSGCKILYVCLAYRGDLIINFPAIEAIKKHFPNCHLACWVREYNETLAKMNHNIDSVMIYEDISLNPYKAITEAALSGRHENLTKKIGDFDIYIDDTGYAFTAIAGFQAKIPIRIGRNFQGFGFLNHFEFPLDPNSQLIERRLKILKVFGMDLNLSDISKPYFKIEQSIRDTVLNECGLANLSYFTVQPFGGWEAKNWGIGRYCHVVKQFAMESGLMPVFLGSEMERDEISRAIAEHRLKAINMAGTASLDQAVSIIAGAKIHFGADSVGSQVAISLDVKSLTIFGPANPLLCSYLGGNNFGIIKRTKCTPKPGKLYCCFDAGRSCPSLSCMKELREEDVLKVFTAIWRGQERSSLIEL